MAENNLTKNKQGYGYKYTDLAQIHEYLESMNTRYYQYIERTDGDDYIYTVPIIDNIEQKPRRGCRVVQSTLQGVKNPAQEQGSALTYARRYSLLMAFGLATEDDDAAKLSKINVNMQSALREIIKNNKIPNQDVIDLLDVYGYEKLAQIEIKDLKRIQKELEEMKRE